MSALQELRPDVAMMADHLSALFGNQTRGRIEIAWTDTAPPHALKHAETFHVAEIEQAAARAAELNATPMVNVYVGAALRGDSTAPLGRCSDEDADTLTASYADLDDPGAAEAAAQWAYDTGHWPTFVVYTGKAPHTRVQLYWRLLEPLTDRKAWRSILRACCRQVKGDPSVVNPGRVLRLGGSVAWAVKEGRVHEMTRFARPPKGKAWRLPALADAVGYDKAIDGVEDAPAALPSEVTVARVAGPNAFGLPEERIVDGREAYMTRTVYAAFVHLTQELVRTPTLDELFADAWRTYSREVEIAVPGKAVRGPAELRDKCATLLRRFASGELEYKSVDDILVAPRQDAPRPFVVGDQPRFLFETIADLRRLPPARWLVRGWVPERAVGIFYGRWAAGKSFIGFDLALHLAYGLQDWHGVELPPDECDVLILAREGHTGFIKRVSAFKQHHGLPDDTDRLVFMRASVSFMDEPTFAALKEAIKATGRTFPLTIVDTVARVLPGVDMNEQSTVTMFMERCQQLADVCGGTVIGVHHQNKTGSMMGSTYFEANADFVFEVTREGEDGPLEAGAIKCTKQKDAEDGWTVPVAYAKVLTGIGTEDSSLVVKTIGGGQQKPKSNLPPRDVCERMLAFIDAAWRQGNPLNNASQTKTSGRYAPRILGREFGVNPKVVDSLILEWIDSATVAVEVCNSHTKARGLRVIGAIK
jgi:hypothetical protein